MKTQPVIAGLLARWVVTWAASKGFELDVNQTLALFGALELLITGAVWSLVTPNAKVEQKVQEAVKRSSLPPGTIVGIVALLALAGCAEPTAAGALCRTRANGKWALQAEALCPDTDKGGEEDWDRCPHRQAILDGLAADLERCPL